VKISELEYHHGEFMAFEGRIKDMLDKHEFPAIFSVCVESFPHIVPAIQYRKKREIVPETPDLLAFEVICKYAPPLFEHTAIESLFELIKSTRILANNEYGFLQAIETAIKNEEIARILWNKLEIQPGTLCKDIYNGLGEKQVASSDVLETWRQLGIIIQKQEENHNRLYLRSLLNEEVEGVCQNCGIHGKGRKELFFKLILCQKCQVEGYYHIKYCNPK
jgi:hypothetical protein